MNWDSGDDWSYSWAGVSAYFDASASVMLDVPANSGSAILAGLLEYVTDDADAPARREGSDRLYEAVLQTGTAAVCSSRPGPVCPDLLGRL